MILTNSFSLWNETALPWQGEGRFWRLTKPGWGNAKGDGQSPAGGDRMEESCSGDKPEA